MLQAVTPPSLDDEPIAPAVRAFIEENFLFRSNSAELLDDQSLMAADLLDSTGVLELVAFLEERFGIVMQDAEIVPENLDSIRAISAFVARKRSS